MVSAHQQQPQPFCVGIPRQKGETLCVVWYDVAEAEAEEGPRGSTFYGGQLFRRVLGAQVLGQHAVIMMRITLCVPRWCDRWYFTAVP